MAPLWLPRQVYLATCRYHYNNTITIPSVIVSHFSYHCYIYIETTILKPGWFFFQLITISSTPATATSLTLDQTIVSNIVTLSPFSTLEGSSATVSVPYTPYAGSMGASPQMMWSANQNGPYTEGPVSLLLSFVFPFFPVRIVRYFHCLLTCVILVVDSTCSNNICTAQATSGGNYVLVSKVNVGAIIGVILGSAALLVLIGFCIFKPMTLRKMYLPGAENPLNQAV
jgi:hypothetical protein